LKMFIIYIYDMIGSNRLLTRSKESVTEESTSWKKVEALF
jgi:hypothetical protein